MMYGMMVALGVLIGASLFSKGGWKRVLIAVALISIATVLDRLWGAEVGHALAEMTKSVVE